MHRFTPRITRSYSDLSGAFVQDIQPSVFRLIVCEHEADEEVNRTHVHCLLYNSVIKEEAFKRRINKHFETQLKGNSDWSWVNKLPESDNNEFWQTGDYGTANEFQIFKYIKYCLKGNINNLKLKNNIGDRFIAEAIAAWDNNSNKTDAEAVTFEKVKKVPFQQNVISHAAPLWKQYKDKCKEENTQPELQKLKDIVCQEMVNLSKGINPYLVRELCYAILYNDLDYKDHVLNKITL